MPDAIVQIQHLTKRYGDLTALDDVTLDIARGEILALLGPNGAGKTTLIGIVAGLTRRTSGDVRVNGLDVIRDYRQTRLTIGLVPQEINFDPFFTVEEAIRFQAGYFGRRLSDDALLEILTAMSLVDKRRATTRQLSGGMKRRMLIAKALAHDPDLLFLDEPTAGVDVELRRDLWTYVRKLQARGKTIVLTTHYLEEAEQLADRIGIMDHGRLRLVEDKTTLLQRLGTRVVTIFLSAQIATLPDGLIRLGGHLAADGRAIAFTDRADEPLGSKLEAAVSAGLSIRDIEIREPKLEDIFLRLLSHAEAA